MLLAHDCTEIGRLVVEQVMELMGLGSSYVFDFGFDSGLGFGFAFVRLLLLLLRLGLGRLVNTEPAGTRIRHRNIHHLLVHLLGVSAVVEVGVVLYQDLIACMPAAAAGVA